MHAFFLLSALLLAAAIGAVGVVALRLVPDTARRPLALVVLAAQPAVVLAALTHLVPQLWPNCAPLAGWDRVATFVLLAGLGGVALGAVALNTARLALVERLVGACPPLADPAFEAHAAALAARLGAGQPALRLLRLDAPLAVASGVRCRSVLVSSGLLARLDAHELEAVVGHELAHLARHDDLARWLGRLLRDATAYLPGGWFALRTLEADEELSADGVAVRATGRPLAMASALGKVWQSILAGAAPATVAGVPGYVGGSADLLERRLRRLVDGRAEQTPSRVSAHVLAGVGLLSLGELAPRALALVATALPLVCTTRPH